MKKNTKTESKHGGVTSRSALYAHTSKYSKEAIDFLVSVMRNKEMQASVRVSAANKIVDKCLPDLKATELTGEDKGPIQIKIIDEVIRNADE